MADMNPQKMEQPASGAAPTSGMQARIFTMPERYRYGSEGKMHEPMVKQPAIAPIQVNAPAIPAPKAPPKPPPLKRKASMTKKLLLIGIIVLLILAVGGYFLVYFSPQPASQTPSSTTRDTTRPAPVVDEEKEPEPVPEEEPETEPEVFFIEVTPGTDSDSDGLTDTEENLVYGTNSKLPDTDADGFLDGNEVFHGYNPGGTAPGTLIESGLVEDASGTFNGSSYAFSYPSAWDLEEVDGKMVLDASTGEGFRFSFVEEELPAGDVRTTKQGLSYVLSDNQLTAYVSLGTSVLKLEYDTGLKAKVDYLQTFQMMLNTVAYASSASEPIDSQGGTETSTQETPQSP
ncbi:MAG: hypothetical protein NUV84_02135 [Candidatus Uhrbacteria bacterium]|nr:hypothetical protein [Candidatus Uhrbacteria bacterium]